MFSMKKIEEEKKTQKNPSRTRHPLPAPPGA